MSNYFVREADIPDSYALKSNGVVFADFVLGEPGYMVDKRNLDRIVNLFGVQVLEAKPTQLEGVTWLRLSAPTKQAMTVTFVGSKDASRDEKARFIQEVTTWLRPAVGDKPVLIYGPVGKRSKLVKHDDGFHILLWTSATTDFINWPSGPKLDSPDAAWGYKLMPSDGTTKRFGPKGLGHLITDDRGETVAELIENQLFVHIPINVKGATENDYMLLRKLLQKAAEVISGANAALAFKSKKERDQARFVELCSRSVRIRHEKIVSRVNENEAALGKKMAEVKAIMDALQQDRAMVQLFDSVESIQLKLAGDFERLFDIRGVENIEFKKGGVLSVFTDTLYCRNPSTRRYHEIGKFEIQIGTDPEVWVGVKWKNLTRRIYRDGVGHFDAPHIRDGTACFGNMADVFPKLLAEQQYSALIQMAIRFVETVNLDDQWGQYIDRWPTVDRIPEKPRKAEPAAVVAPPPDAPGVGASPNTPTMGPWARQPG